MHIQPVTIFDDTSRCFIVIALETSKGDLPLAVALGLVLLAVILILNGLAYGLRLWAMRRYA